MTSSYFATEHEDELRRGGWAKEHRGDPQIVVGLVVERTGFPPEVFCLESRKAEARTIMPVVQEFQAQHAISDMVSVTDASVLSAANLTAIDDAGLRFIVAPGRQKQRSTWPPSSTGTVTTQTTGTPSTLSHRVGRRSWIRPGSIAAPNRWGRACAENRELAGDVEATS